MYSNEDYPASNKMFEQIQEFISESLSLFLSEIILNDKKGKARNTRSYETKCTSIDHAIISAVRPRSFISPQHVALAVTLHRKFGSKKVIDICNALGFCGSYKEAKFYESSATFESPARLKEGTFVQFVHDKADFNVNTLDGKGTFHYLRSIEIVTPGHNIEPKEQIKRLEKIPSETEICKQGNMPLEMYQASAGDGLRQLQMQTSKQVNLRLIVLSKLNILWMFLK